VTDIQLRQATIADVAAIRALTRAAYAKWVPIVGRESAPMTADYEAAILTHRFDLLEREGQLVALIETVDEGDQLLIENIAVAPGLQGKGLGHVLLAHAERLAADLGCERIRLFTNQRFAENISLYQSVGYAIEREEDLGFAIRVHMSKRAGE
jgi:N-acetylglutamate synthase-like GNAT family acetyltransferase